MKECICCGGSTIAPAYAGLTRCQTCGHMWADFAASDAELFRLYGRDYFFGEEYSDYLADRSVAKRNFGLRVDVLRRYLGPVHRRLFEIGSAYGLFLDSVRDKFEAVQGIDVTEDGVRHAREQLHLDVIQGDFLEHQMPAVPFDVICLWDTIEHLRQPQLYLKKLSEHLRTGALIAITTGDVESLNARVRGAKWRLIHPPTHLHYFSRRSLARLLNRNGFDVVFDEHCGFYRSVDLIIHNVVSLRCGMPRAARVLRSLGLGRIELFTNLYDISYMIGVKR